MPSRSRETRFARWSLERNASHEVAGVEGGELRRLPGREAESPQAPAAALTHVVLESRHPVVAEPDRVRVPRPGGEHDQGVEHTLR